MLLKMAQINRNLQFLRVSLNTQIKCRWLSTKAEVIEDKPIKFSTSDAARNSVIPIMKKPSPQDMPWYQPYSVVGSVALFLLYFCVLREENDVDLELNKTLYDRIHGLEKEQLLQSYRYNKEHGKSVDDIARRLQEIEEEESKAL